MADEAPPKLIQIGPKGGAKKDGFNLVTERVVAVNPEAKQLEVELLAYDGKTVVLDVDDEALEELKKLKVGDGATIRVVEEGGRRIAKSFRIRAKDPNAARADAMLLDLKDSHWLTISRIYCSIFSSMYICLVKSFALVTSWIDTTCLIVAKSP